VQLWPGAKDLCKFFPFSQGEQLRAEEVNVDTSSFFAWFAKIKLELQRFRRVPHLSFCRCPKQRQTRTGRPLQLTIPNYFFAASASQCTDGAVEHTWPIMAFVGSAGKYQP